MTLNLCAVCGARISPRARTCSSSCRNALSMRRKRARPPSGADSPLHREAWEAERRLDAGRAADALDDLVEWIPEHPEDAAALRARVSELADELRDVFTLPRRPR